MPGFARLNPFDAVPSHAHPRLWIGNRVRTPTHFDPSHNLACLVAGRRRFTLFPPEQICNLYPGPIDINPGGVPVSMVEIEAPDFETYPLFEHALPHARFADLEPGDVLYIPSGWRHHVQSGAPFNLLVNYWWSEAKESRPPLFSPLFLAIATWRDLPEDEKALWKRLTDLYVFGDHQKMSSHLPPKGKGLSGPMTAEVAQRLKAFMKNAFGRY
ncbi:MAG: cupin-like domain-containing protein [Asticcacaulis sp.]|nr:cupin-like domain-containing protein [Asticcacaulis sp.]